MSGILKWMVPLTIFSYLLYVINYICPQQSSSIFIDNWVCESYAYIRPSVGPFINIVTTKLEEIITKLHLDPFVSQVEEKSSEIRTCLEPWVNQIKERVPGMTDKLNTVVTPLANLIESTAFELKIRIVPMLNVWLNELNVHSQVVFTKSWEWLKFRSRIIWVQLSYRLHGLFSNQVKPYLKIYLFKLQNHSTYLILKHYFHEYKLDIAFDWISCCYRNLMDVNNFQEKSEFLRNEFKNLMHLKTDMVPQGNEAEVSEVVKDILEDLTSPMIMSTTCSSASEDSYVSEDYTISSITSDSSVSSIMNGFSFEESDSDSEEPITILITSTRFVTLETGTKEPSFVDNSISHKIEEEINYWENKVNRTLNSALKNLSKDMSAIIKSSIDTIKPTLSDKFTKIQQTNYKHYQELNLMINAIDKDSTQIQEEKRVIESADDSSRKDVSRQDMRDKISESLTYCESELDAIKESIQKDHQHILSEYFKEIQETIDVLESFAELTIQEFSNRLHSLTTILENEQDLDEEVTWKSWKRFHKIKQEIFNARDLIFNEANNYQDDSSINIIPAGLETWNTYLRNINFHINFLGNDDEEYLKLVRAKANVAFQLRESLIDRLKDPVESDDAEQVESETIEINEEQLTETSKQDSPIDYDESEASPLDYESGEDSEGTGAESEDLN